jgi:hypothetical protein
VCLFSCAGSIVPNTYSKTYVSLLERGWCYEKTQCCYNPAIDASVCFRNGQIVFIKFLMEYEQR